MPRLYCPLPLATGHALSLPPTVARHVQVLRLQPGGVITLFNGDGGEFEAVIDHMGRSDVTVTVGKHILLEREARRAVHLAVGMPANERMDWLVEKATELGVSSIQPLMTERTVVRLDGDRAAKRAAHWLSVAVAACEQCGRNRIPVIHPIASLSDWIRRSPATTPHSEKLLLSLQAGSRPLQALLTDSFDAQSGAIFLSGPEGGFSGVEESAALAAGFSAVSLGSRVLRAETAALAALTLMA